jgi:3'-5' exoribonuclease
MPTRPHTDIRNLPASGYVEGVYALVNPQIGTTRAGKSYLKCLLRDATGEVVARQWTFDDSAFAALSEAGFVWAAGHTQVYNGQIQIILEQVKPVEVSREEIRSLLPTSKKDIDAMFAAVCRTMRTLRDPSMSALVEAFLGDEELMESFRMAPAAMTLHHAWIGGLLEHTLQLLELAEYTADGNLVGHVVRGAIWLQFKAAVAARQSGQRLPPAALRVLQHMILSHHGDPEYGAAKMPSTPEAIFVALLDNLDAKTAMALSAADRESRMPADESGAFTDKIWALGTRIYRPDPLAESGAAAGAASTAPTTPAPPAPPAAVAPAPPAPAAPPRTAAPAAPAAPAPAARTPTPPEPRPPQAPPRAPAPGPAPKKVEAPPPKPAAQPAASRPS